MGIVSWPYCWARTSGRKCQRLGIEITPEHCEACFFRSPHPPEPEPVEGSADAKKKPPSDGKNHGGRRGHMVVPLNGIVGRRYKDPRPSKEEFRRREAELEAKACATCQYHSSINGGTYYMYCDYLSQTGRARPCRPGECKEAGVWKKAKGGAKASKRPFVVCGAEKAEEDEDELVARIRREREREKEDEKV